MDNDYYHNHHIAMGEVVDAKSMHLDNRGYSIAYKFAHPPLSGTTWGRVEIGTEEIEFRVNGFGEFKIIKTKGGDPLSQVVVLDNKFIKSGKPTRNGVLIDYYDKQTPKSHALMVSYEYYDPDSPDKVMDTSILVRWYKAHKIAEENPRLLMRTSTAEECTNASNLCSERMKECDAADIELFKITNIPLLNLFRAAEANLPKCSCSVHSSPTMQHPECMAKLNEWFAYRDALMVYVYGRYIRGTEHAIKQTQRERAEEIVEDLLIKLSHTKIVGDALESIPMEDYEDLEEYMTHIVEGAL